MEVVGVDACRGGWLGLALTAAGPAPPRVFGGMVELLTELAEAQVVAVDIPIGLPGPGGVRPADRAAARFVGPRRSSVFLTPPREVLAAPDYGEARRLARRLWVQGVSAQAYALRRRILEVEPLAERDPRLREVHPEVSFRALAGAPLPHPKRSPEGARLRQALLASAGIRVSVNGLPPRTEPHDLLDAAAAAWSARRIALGLAGALPEEPPQDGSGRIWY